MDKQERQKLLLKVLFRLCGGATELEKHTKIPRQNFTNWQIRGKVPLLKAVMISDIMGISKWGLNYADFKEVCDDAPDWNDVVKSYSLPLNILEQLLEVKSCPKKMTLQKQR